MIEYVCIYKGTKETNNCERCCGIINTCGMYENELGIDPFEKIYSQPTKIIDLSERKKEREIQDIRPMRVL